MLLCWLLTSVHVCCPFVYVRPAPFCFFPFLLSIFFPFLLFAFSVHTAFTISFLCTCFLNFWFVLHLLIFFGYVFIVSLAFSVSFGLKCWKHAWALPDSDLHCYCLCLSVRFDAYNCFYFVLFFLHVCMWFVLTFMFVCMHVFVLAFMFVCMHVLKNIHLCLCFLCVLLWTLHFHSCLKLYLCSWFFLCIFALYWKKKLELCLILILI